MTHCLGTRKSDIGFCGQVGGIQKHTNLALKMIIKKITRNRKDKIKQCTVTMVSWIRFSILTVASFNFLTITFVILLENYIRILLKDIVRYPKGGVGAQLLRY